MQLFVLESRDIIARKTLPLDAAASGLINRDRSLDLNKRCHSISLPRSRPSCLIPGRNAGQLVASVGFGWAVGGPLVLSHCGVCSRGNESVRFSPVILGRVRCGCFVGFCNRTCWLTMGTNVCEKTLLEPYKYGNDINCFEDNVTLVSSDC